MNILKLIVNKNDAINALDKNIRAAQADYQERLGKWTVEMKEHIAKLNEYILAPDYEEEVNGKYAKPIPLAPYRPFFPVRLMRLRERLVTHAFDTVEINEIEHTSIFKPYTHNNIYATIDGGKISSGTIAAGDLQL